MVEQLQEAVMVEQPQLPSPEVNMRVFNSVFRVLRTIVGEQAGESIFWNLQMTRGLSRDDIPERPAQFVEGIRGIFGDEATKMMEIAMAKELQKEFGLESSDGEEGFIELVSRATRSFR